MLYSEDVKPTSRLSDDSAVISLAPGSSKWRLFETFNSIPSFMCGSCTFLEVRKVGWDHHTASAKNEADLKTARSPVACLPSEPSTKERKGLFCIHVVHGGLQYCAREPRCMVIPTSSHITLHSSEEWSCSCPIALLEHSMLGTPAVITQLPMPTMAFVR